MADDAEGTVGCILMIAAGAGLYWWLSGGFDHKNADIEPPPVITIAPTPAPSPRPTGMTPIAFPKGGGIWELDLSTVRGPRSAREAWVTADYSGDKSMVPRTVKTLYLVDCDTGADRELASIAYDAKGGSLPLYSSETAADKAPPRYFPPGTVGATVPDKICQAVFDSPANGAPGDSSQ